MAITGVTTADEIESKGSIWDPLYFLEGLKGQTKPSIAQLFECEASTLIEMEEEKNKPNDPWFVYMVECSDKTYYTGITNDLSKRLLTHNMGKGAKYTRGRLPVALMWFKRCDNKSEASKLEYKIKKMSRKDKIKMIGNGKRQK